LIAFSLPDAYSLQVPVQWVFGAFDVSTRRFHPQYVSARFREWNADYGENGGPRFGSDPIIAQWLATNPLPFSSRRGFALSQLLAGATSDAWGPKDLSVNAPKQVLVISIPDRKLALTQNGHVVKVYSIAVGAAVSPSSPTVGAYF
jgi:hypothetical protein